MRRFKELRFYAIMLDPMPDIAHIDQYSEISGYIYAVHVCNDKVEVTEVFLRFITISNKTLVNIFKQALLK